MRIKILLLFPVLVLVNCVKAQINRGEIMLGGTFSINTSKLSTNDQFNSVTKSTQIFIGPQVGFGLGKNWIAGAAFGYSHYKQINEPAFNFREASSNIVSVNALLRKFHPLGDRIGIFGQADAGVGFGNVKTQDATGDEFEDKLTNYFIMVRPGFYFKPTKKIVVEAIFGRVGFTTTTRKSANDFKVTSSQFEFSLTNSLGFAFQVIL